MFRSTLDTCSSVINKGISMMPSGTQYLFYAAGLGIAGRKIGPAIFCKIASVVTQTLGRETAAEWNDLYRNYWLQAKKDAVKDLSIGIGIALTGLTLAQEKEILKLREETNTIKALQPKYPLRYESFKQEGLKETIEELNEAIKNFLNPKTEIFYETQKEVNEAVENFLGLKTSNETLQKVHEAIENFLNSKTGNLSDETQKKANEIIENFLALEKISNETLQKMNEAIGNFLNAKTGNVIDETLNTAKETIEVVETAQKTLRGIGA